MKTIKGRIDNMQEDHDFYEKQIKKERKITIQLKHKIADCIDQHETNFIGMFI